MSTVAIGFENKEHNIHALATFLAGYHKYLKIQFILHKNTSSIHYKHHLVKTVLAKKKKKSLIVLRLVQNTQIHSARQILFSVPICDGKMHFNNLKGRPTPKF